MRDERSASFAELPRHVFESTLDMLSGVHPVEELAEVRPRITYDRAAGRLQLETTVHFTPLEPAVRCRLYAGKATPLAPER